MKSLAQKKYSTNMSSFSSEGKSVTSASHTEPSTVIVCGWNQAKHMKRTQEMNKYGCQQETLLFFLLAKPDFPRDTAFLWITQQPLNPDIVSQAGDVFTVKMLTSTSSLQSPAATFCKLN